MSGYAKKQGENVWGNVRNRKCPGGNVGLPVMPISEAVYIVRPIFTTV